MGQPIPEAIEVDPVAAGDACMICWGTDKPFGDGDTPESITVNFSGVQKGPDWLAGDGEPIEGEFELTQDPGNACTFNGGAPDFLIICDFTAVNTEVTVLSALGPIAFLSQGSGPCETLVFNEEVSEFENGSCKIIIPEVE